MKNLKPIILGALVALTTAPLGGCALGGPGPLAVDAANQDSLIEVTPGTTALDSVDSTDWMAAPAGCEGRIDGDTEFALASAPSGLIAAVDAMGRVICVDTVESVQQELEEEGLVILGQVAQGVRAADLEIGMEVEVDLQVLRRDDEGVDHWVWTWAPIAAGEGSK